MVFAVQENGAAAFVQQIDRFMEEYVDTGLGF